MFPLAAVCRPPAAELLKQAENAGGEPTHARLIPQAGQRQPQHPKMEFLDINLTKESSLVLHAIHSPFSWWILKKTILFSRLLPK
jgi:hypothetical protein